MMRSMTGFGQAVRHAAGYRMQVDVKSVNHRYMELAVRLPKEWLQLEEPLKKRIQAEVRRGRVDVFVELEREGGSGRTVELDAELARGYLDAAEQLKREMGLAEERLSLMDLLNIPNVVRFRETHSADADQVEAELLQTAEEAVSRLVSMREAEGRHLQTDLDKRLATLRELHRRLQELAPQTAAEQHSKLTARLKELLNQVPLDEQRVAMESAVLADRSSVDEELTRLQSHFSQFELLLQADEPVGRKLDFLLQEMNREANTIGSKSGGAELTVLVVELKAELEKIREQVQNIE